jgi:transposase InsO family protein
LSLVGEKVTLRPESNKAKAIQKRNEERARKQHEDFLEKKRFLVAKMRAGGQSVRHIADRLGMSVGFVHKWCKRLVSQICDIITRSGRHGKKYREGHGILDAIKSRSTAPKSPFRKVTDEHRMMIIGIRNSDYTRRMGAQKIKVFADLDISHQTIHKILRESDLVKPYKKRKQRSFNPFRRDSPNDLWQIDYKQFGRNVWMLSVKDDHSSMILSAEVRGTCTTDDVIEILSKTVRLFGAPKQILSDHGVQWYSVRGGVSRFDKWCSEQGIEHIMGRIAKPTTQGKIERWHGTVIEEAQLPPKGSGASEYRKAVLRYMEFYNNSRPHHGIGLQVPIIVYMGGLILNSVYSTDGVHEVS